MTALSGTHPKLYRKGVFCDIKGEAYISTWALQEKVFKSIIAMAADRVVNNINYRRAEGFRIYLRTNPPSLNIRIEFTEKEEKDSLLTLFQRVLDISTENGNQPVKKTIDVDIVPGNCVNDTVLREALPNSCTKFF